MIDALGCVVVAGVLIHLGYRLAQEFFGYDDDDDDDDLGRAH